MNDVTAARAARDERIRELRALGWLQKAIAVEVGCSQVTVSRVLDPAQIERMRAHYRTDEYREGYRKWYRGYVEANTEAIQDRRQADLPAARERARARRQKDLEGVKAGNKASYERRRQRVLAQQREYREKNGEFIRERTRARYAADPEAFRANWTPNPEAKRAKDARRRARRRGSNSQPLDAVDRLLSVEYRKAIAGDPCMYCGSLGEQDDHKLPIARGGTDHWWNLQRTCRSCNLRKHVMTHEEFLASGRAPLAAASLSP